MSPAKNPPPGDDAWASLDESDNWNEPHEHAAARDTNDFLGDSRSAPKPSSAVLARYALVGPAHERYALDPNKANGVGRSSHNQVVLSDASISRDHARLSCDHDGWKVTDLQSANGTFVAGQRVDTAQIAPGDPLDFGSVHLVFEDREHLQPKATALAPGALNEPVLASPKKAHAEQATVQPGRKNQSFKRRLVKGVLVLAVAGFGLTLWHNCRVRRQAFACCETGFAAFAAQRWDDAEQAFADALVLVPDMPVALQYSDAVALVRQKSQQLADVHTALEANELGRARELLQTLGATVLVNEALASAQAIRRATDLGMGQVQAALDAQLNTEAESLVATLGQPLPVRPDVEVVSAWLDGHTATTDLMRRAATLERRQGPKTLLARADTQPPAMRRAILVFRRSPAEVAPKAAMGALGVAGTALEVQLVAALNRFAHLWDAGVVEHRGKRAFAAIKLFTQARSEADRVAGRNSVPARQVNAKLADMYYVLGVQALGPGRLAEASEALRTAVLLNPAHALSRRKLDELEARASRLIDEATFVRTSHTARAHDLCRQVVSSMPKTSPASRRAQALLRELTAVR